MNRESIMHVSALERLRITASARALQALLARPAVRRRLARSKQRHLPVEGRVLDEHLAAMLGLDDVTGDSSYLGLPPERARRRMAISVAIVDAPCSREVTTRDLSWRGPSGSRPARLYTPGSLPSPSPALVYFHGGGWVVGDLDTHDALCRKLAAFGQLRVIAIDYRRAPEHPFPAAADDAVAAYRHVIDHASDLGIDPTKVGVGGDSAGGNLSAVIGLECARDRHPPALTLLLYPGLDATLAHASHATFGDRWMLTRPMIDWYYDHYTHGRDDLRREPRLSPLHAKDVSGAPPALILPAHFDPLRDEALRYAERLDAANVPVRVSCFETFIHGFAMMTRASPAAARAVERIAERTGDSLRRGELVY